MFYVYLLKHIYTIYRYLYKRMNMNLELYPTCNPYNPNPSGRLWKVPVSYYGSVTREMTESTIYLPLSI